MCVECGTVLSVSNSPVAQQERAFIREQIAAGKNKDADQGRARRRVRRGVLAEPGHDGFNVDAVDRADRRSCCSPPSGSPSPSGAGAAAARPPEPELPPPLSAEDARRLDAELSR